MTRLAQINNTQPLRNAPTIDYKHPIVSEYHKDIYMVANYVLITTAISLFGVVANIINIIVFFKQGFNSSVNISFCAIAVSDLGSLLALLWGGVLVNPLFVHSDTGMVPFEISYLTSGLPHICFVRITAWLTVFITAEKCLCILLPLKIKQIITPKVTMVTVLLIYVCIMLSFVPEFEIAYIDWKFYPERNKTLLGLIFTSEKSSKGGIVFLLYSIFRIFSCAAVILFTIILIQQLKRISQWRNQATNDRKRSESISIRDQKTMKMVVVVAILLIVCYIPGGVISMTTFLVAEFGIVGEEQNVFFVACSFAFIFEALNSSVNIFAYYNMSSKFRDTFQETFITSDYVK